MPWRAGLTEYEKAEWQIGREKYAEDLYDKQIMLGYLLDIEKHLQREGYECYGPGLMERKDGNGRIVVHARLDKTAGRRN